MQHHLEHYMFLGYLRGETVKELTDYLRKACRFPLCPLRRYLMLAPDKLISELNAHISKPPLREQGKWAWISGNTWAAIEARVTALR